MSYLYLSNVLEKTSPSSHIFSYMLLPACGTGICISFISSSSLNPLAFYFTAEMVITITLNRLEPYQKLINIKFIWVIHC